MTIRDRFRAAWFALVTGPQQPAADAAAAVTVRVDDSPGWTTHQAGPTDRPWTERAEDLDDALEAWQKNFLIRRITTLIRSYVVGGGLSISSKDPAIDTWIQAFWNHHQNRMARRLGPMCDELTRSGELFCTLHTNHVDGMSYIRFVPASQIREIETAPNDYEIETRFGEAQPDTADLKWWLGPGHRDSTRTTRAGRLRPLMLHFTVNKPIGATRGEGDLAPILPWALRYSEWLKDRVRLNRQRTRQAVMDIKIADDAMVETKRAQLRTDNPVEAGIYVHGPGEETKLNNLEIDASDAAEDGKLLRLANATGANVALHYLGEGEAVNYATAKEMGEPTSRFFTERQNDFTAMLIDITAAAYQRAALLGQVPAVRDLRLVANATEVARADNLTLATAANYMVQALAQMQTAGWIDDSTALALAMKFAGEALDEAAIAHILAHSPHRSEGTQKPPIKISERKGDSSK